MSDDVIDFNEIKKGQVAATKPQIYCVVGCKYEDTTLVATVHVCFFTEREAGKALEWFEKNAPIPLPVGWYEIAPSKLSQMQL